MDGIVVLMMIAYIRHQLDEDRMGEQLMMLGKDDNPFKGGK